MTPPTPLGRGPVTLPLSSSVHDSAVVPWTALFEVLAPSTSLLCVPTGHTVLQPLSPGPEGPHLAWPCPGAREARSALWVSGEANPGLSLFLMGLSLATVTSPHSPLPEDRKFLPLFKRGY